MAPYRLYFLDDKGHILAAVDLQCLDDEAALAAAQAKRDGRAMELWSLDRRVRSFPAEPG